MRSIVEALAGQLERIIDKKAEKAAKPTESVSYARVISSDNGEIWVHVIGGPERTPVTETIASVERGDVVKVRISGGKCAIEGNVTSPSASSTVVERVVTGTIGKTVERLDRLEADVVVVNDILYAAKAIIDQLDVDELEAATAYIETLIAGDVTAESIVADEARISDLEANSATITDLNAEHARVNSLFSGFADIAQLETDEAIIEFLRANYATIQELDAHYIETDVLNGKYAKIDFENVVGATIEEATMQKVIAKSGWFENLSSEGGTFTGKLKAVVLDGDTALFRNIYADALKILGEDGLYHALNFMRYDETATYTEVSNPTGNPAEQGWYIINERGEYSRTTDTSVVSGHPTYYVKAYTNFDTAAYWSRYGEDLEEGLHGSNIIAETITATQIDVSTLVAAMLLTQYIQIGASGSVHIESNGERFSFFNGGYGWERIAKDYASYFTQVPTPVLGSPKTNLYYEKDSDNNFVRTQDEEPVSGKAYWFQYEAIQSPTGDPSGHHWYEMDSTGYMTLTDDHSVVQDKTYYRGLITATDKLPGEVAYIAVDPNTNQSWFYINNEVVVNELRFGKWQWRSLQGSNNLVLKWIG